jgi:hypothetical protein
MVLVGDVLGDLSYFSVVARREPSLIVAATLRNMITLLAVGALFRKERWAGYVLLIAAILGLWRRVSYLWPLTGAGSAQQDWMLYTSGLDTAFRCLLFGFAAGYLAGKAQVKE